MMNAPRLLNNRNTDLQRSLFSDLQLDKLLSAQAIAVLQHPCEPDEIVRRNELFLLLDKCENAARLEHTLSALCATERALLLYKDAKLPLDTYHRQAEALESYIASCEALASMRGMGSLFADVADYFSSEKMQKLLSEMTNSARKIRILLQKMNAGFLSFSDKNWLTPDYDAVSEFDSISECAESLGFFVPKKKVQNTKINHSLSDTICHLYADEASQIEAEIAKYADVDFYAPTVYSSEIRFFLEINALTQRAAKIGVPHVIAKIAQTPMCVSKELFDVSLLAKNCESIVPNDADFTENEPFAFLLGANGGGKTTYLRALGVNLVLFLAGCPVFAREAEIYPFDIVLSHFPKDERFDNAGRLDEERGRTEKMLDAARGKRAFMFFNETYSGADEKRGFDLLTDTAKKIKESNFFGLYVTHFHEVMTLDHPVLSAEVDLDDANKRTFRIVRSKGSASSYAADILKKHRLDKDSLAARRYKDGN